MGVRVKGLNLFLDWIHFIIMSFFLCWPRNRPYLQIHIIHSYHWKPFRSSSRSKYDRDHNSDDNGSQNKYCYESQNYFASCFHALDCSNGGSTECFQTVCVFSSYFLRSLTCLILVKLINNTLTIWRISNSLILFVSSKNPFWNLNDNLFDLISFIAQVIAWRHMFL